MRLDDDSHSLPTALEIATNLYKQGLSCFAKGDFKSAIKNYSKALKILPGFLEIYLDRSNAYICSGDIDRATKDLDSLPILFSENAYFHQLWGSIHFQLEDYHRALESLDKAISIETNNANLFWTRGLIHEVLDDYIKSIDDLKAALIHSQNNLDIIADLRRLYLTSGLNHWRENQINVAIVNFREAQYLELNDSLPYCYTGMIYVGTGDIEKGVDYYSQAVIRSPFPEYNFLLGHAYSYKFREKSKAIEYFSKAISVDSEFAEAYCLRGNAFYALGDIDRAFQDYKRVLEIYPNPCSPLFSSCLEDSRAETRQIIYEVYPALLHIRSSSLLLKGWIHCDLEQYQEAIEGFNQLLSEVIQSNNFNHNSLRTVNLEDVYFSLGAANLGLGNYENSIEYCNEALNINSSLANAYWIRGIAFYEQEYGQDAIWDIQEASKLFFEQGHKNYSDEALSTIRQFERPKQYPKLPSGVVKRYINDLFKSHFVNVENQLDKLGNQISNIQLNSSHHSDFTERLSEFKDSFEEIISTTILDFYDLQVQLDLLSSKLINQTHNSSDEIDIKLLEFSEEIKNKLNISNSESTLLIGRSKSRSVLSEALEKVEEHLILVCPWLNTSVINKTMLQKIESLLQRGIKIEIGWGYPESNINFNSLKALSQDKRELIEKFRQKSDTWKYNAIPFLEQFENRFPHTFQLSYPRSTHEKFLICDKKFAMITSHNFLTSDDRSPVLEVGIRTTSKKIIKGLIEHFTKPHKYISS